MCTFSSCLQGTRRYGSEDAEPIDWIVPPGMSDGSGRMSNPGLSEMFAYHATTMANTIGTSLVVFTRKVGAQRGWVVESWKGTKLRACTGGSEVMLVPSPDPSNQYCACHDQGSSLAGQGLVWADAIVTL